MCHVRALPNVEYFQTTVKEDLRHNHGRGKLSTKTGTQRHTWLEPAGHAGEAVQQSVWTIFFVPCSSQWPHLAPAFRMHYSPGLIQGGWRRLAAPSQLGKQQLQINPGSHPVNVQFPPGWTRPKTGSMDLNPGSEDPSDVPWQLGSRDLPGQWLFLVNEHKEDTLCCSLDQLPLVNLAVRLCALSASRTVR